MTHPDQRDGRESDTGSIQVSAPGSLCSIPPAALTSEISDGGSFCNLRSQVENNCLKTSCMRNGDKAFSLLFKALVHFHCFCCFLFLLCFCFLLQHSLVLLNNRAGIAIMASLGLVMPSFSVSNYALYSMSVIISFILLMPWFTFALNALSLSLSSSN